MHTATAVDGYWLAELGPMFFSVKVKAFHLSHCPCELVPILSNLQVKGDGSQNRKEALNHLHKMEEEMKQAEVKMKDDKEAKEAARERERKRQTVVTPGGQG